MPGQTSNSGTATPSGVGTKEGGLVVVSSTPSGGSSGPVSNQQQLVLDSSIFSELSPETRRELKIIQLEYARDVSAAAADAYEKLILAFRAADGRPSLSDRNESSIS
jgi:hypothetical protein